MQDLRRLQGDCALPFFSRGGLGQERGNIPLDCRQRTTFQSDRSPRVSLRCGPRRQAGSQGPVAKPFPGFPGKKHWISRFTIVRRGEFRLGAIRRMYSGTVGVRRGRAPLAVYKPDGSNQVLKVIGRAPCFLVILAPKKSSAKV